MRSRFRHGPRLTIAATIVAAVLAAGGTAVATNLMSSDPSLNPVPVTANAQSAGSWIAAFRQPSGGQHMTAGMRANLTNGYANYGPNVDQARHVQASNGDDAYLTPGTESLCVASANEAFCASQSAVRSGHAVAVDLCSPNLPAGQIEVEWLLPDGVSDVSLGMADGSRMNIPTRSNVYIARVPASGPIPTSIEWDADGTHHAAPTGVPADANTPDCVHPGDIPPPSAFPTPPGQ